MTHTELIKAVAKKMDLSPDEVSILWRELHKTLVTQLQEHDKIRIKNFGAFVVVKHKSRTVPDPREMTKKLVILDQHLPKFRPSEQLRALVKDITPNHVIQPDSTDDELTTEGVSDSNTPDSLDNTNQVVTPKVSDTSPVKETVEEKTEPTEKANLPSMEEETPATENKVGNETVAVPEDMTNEDTADKEEKDGTPGQSSTQTDSDKGADVPGDSSLSSVANIGYIDLTNLTIDKETLNLIPLHTAQKYQLAAIEKHDDTLTVAMIDPGDREAIDLVARQTGLTVEPKITTLSDLQHALDQYGAASSDISEAEGEVIDDSEDETGEDDLESTDAPAAKAVTTILERAVREKASDIHIEPGEKKVIIRYRIDGILQQVMELPKALQASITSRLKIMSNLKIDESRLPQDGRLRVVVDHNPIDFRLSTLPTVTGEKIVMRILDESAGILDFEKLGLSGENLRRVNDNITKAHGMFLVTGPTGSGKTTTLYSVIGKVISPEVNIITVEDPVEYRIPGVNQSQTNSAINYDFASALRSIVRQDPDIILIGEIRDLETATMAVHSALTGHVVLSTLHTNDAAGAIPRLIDMGIEPFLITSSTNVVLAQRLVRRICPDCKEKVELPPETINEIKAEIEKIPESTRKEIKADNVTFYHGKGCSRCSNSGYKGRFGIYEVLVLSESIKQLALKRVSNTEIADQAVKEGMITMKQDGIIKAINGETTLEEVWRVTKD